MIGEIATETGHGQMIWQNDQDGRVRLAMNMAFYYHRVLEKYSQLPKAYHHAKYFMFFGNFEEMMKWVEKYGLLDSLRFAHLGPIRHTNQRSES